MKLTGEGQFLVRAGRGRIDRLGRAWNHSYVREQHRGQLNKAVPANLSEQGWRAGGLEDRMRFLDVFLSGPTPAMDRFLRPINAADC